MSRKYGQRGYQEGERREPSGAGGRSGGGSSVRREPPAPRHNLDRPGGRGLGAPDQQVFRCAVCGADQEAPGAEAFAAVCIKCGAELHSCTNCASFDTGSPWECRRWQERQALPAQAPDRRPGPVTRKSKGNDCPLFSAKTTVEFAKEKPADPADPRAAFDALFK
jgi:hypothetical protein